MNESSFQNQWVHKESSIPTDLAVSLSGVGKRYHHFALENIDLELPTGSVMGFIGANGAGKSTTIRILLGLVHQDAGAVRVLGRAMPAGQTAAKRDIGFVSEDMRLYGPAPLRWHMEFLRPIYPRWDQHYAEELLRRFDLKPEQKIKGLSHGQRVKAALVLALARRPRLLVLDEPTTGLDPVARREVLGELMAVLADEDRTILFSSHNTLDVEQISDRIAFIDRGRIVDSDDKEMFLDRWRRLRLQLPPNAALPTLPGIVEVGGSGRLPVLTTNRSEPAMISACNQLGATVQAVDSMTLEEIFVANVTVLERREQTLAFVMSLPISYREYTAAKLLGVLIIFLIPWSMFMAASFAALAYAPRMQHGLAPYVAIMGVEVLLSTCLIAAVGLVTESQGWTITAVMVGNLALNGLGYLVAHLSFIARDMYGPVARWSAASCGLVLAQIAAIFVVLGGTFLLQSRKRDFL